MLCGSSGGNLSFEVFAPLLDNDISLFLISFKSSLMMVENVREPLQLADSRVRTFERTSGVFTYGHCKSTILL